MALEFSIAIDEWVRRARERTDAAVQATALDAVNTVKALTPVKTGFLRANWTVIRNNDPIPMPGRVERPEDVIARIRAGDRILIVNPVVYAARIEYGFVGQDSAGRTFDQKGRAMMQQTIAKLPDIARRAAARVAAGGDPLASPVESGVP